MKMKEFIKKNWNYIAVFLIPWLIVVIHCIMRDSWLTGNGSLLNGDTKIQLYPLFVEFWNKVHSGESLFFSWNAGNGIDFYSNFAYYLISPFNLIVLLCPKAWIENTVQFVMVLKWSLTGVTMVYYFMHTKHNRLEHCKTLVSGIMGLAFVLSNYMIMELGYFNWTDVIILFPILLLLLENMIETGKWKLYCMLLALSMICNFYMAYQVCIFLTIWFLLHICRKDTAKIKKGLLFIGSSCLSAVISLVVILPCVMSVSNRYSTDTISSERLEFMKDIINGIYDFGARMFMFQGNLLDWNSYQPRVYFSIGFFVLTTPYFFIKLSKWEKIKVTGLWLFLVISCCSGVLTVLWHGFAIPNGIFQRYLYMFVFVMLYMALYVFMNMESLKYWKLFVAAILEGALLIYAFFGISHYEDFYGYLLTAVFFALYQIILVLYVKKSIQLKHFIITFSIFVFVELFANALYEFEEYNLSTWDMYGQNANTSSAVMDVELEDGERINMSQTVFNAGLYEGLPSTNMFVSYCNGNMVHLYNQLGLSYSKNAFCSADGTSPLCNLLLNTRYGTSTGDASFSDEELISSPNGMNLYRMNRLAGLGYMVDESITDWDVDSGVNYDLQNSFVNKATGEDAIFDIVTFDATFTDGYLDYSGKEEYLEKGYYSYDYVAKNIQSVEMTDFYFTVPEDMDLYMTAFCDGMMRNFIYVDEEQLFYDEVERYEGTYHIGQVKKGQSIHIFSKHFLGVGDEAEVWFRFASFNEEHYAKAYEKLSKNVYNIDHMNSTYVSGKIHADEDGVMMTSIPAVDGFSVYVDGKKTKYEAIGNAFIGVPLSQGDHKVEFKYITPYFIKGLIGSVLGCLIFLGICVYDFKGKSQK